MKKIIATLVAVATVFTFHIALKHKTYQLSGVYNEGTIITNDGHEWFYDADIDNNTEVLIEVDNHCTNKVDDDEIIKIYKAYDHFILSGETMWTLCQDDCPDGMDLREFIWLTEKYNGNDGHLQANSTIKLLEEVK